MKTRLKIYLPVFRWTGKNGDVVTQISGRTFATEPLARDADKRRGPFTPEGMKVIDVIEVEWVER